MIEVLFGESEAGSMKAAKSNSVKIIGGNNVPAPYTGDSPISHETKGLSGTSNEVICLGFMLDIGNIKEAVTSQTRQDLIFSMYTQNGWDNRPEVIEELKSAGKLYINELDRFTEFIDNGESIRIWCSNKPYSLCGLYFLCNHLKEYPTNITVIKLPEHIQTTENIITEYCHWGEISPNEFSKFLIYEKTLTPYERKIFDNQWAELVEDNSPLRTVVNGQLIGVPIDFYDFIIEKRLSKKPVKEARLIGDILGKYPIGIGDWWYASRIEDMIRAGYIQIIEDSEHKYARTLCLA
ncbi:MAG: DUF3658 domain-containing protein [Anaerocolumna sp.]